MLTPEGKVSEAPIACFFMVRDGQLITPSTTSNILESITRETVLTLCRERLQLEPLEREMDRSEILAADEAFFCGTGWEITPLVNVDGTNIGNGEPGPLTKALQNVYSDIVHGRDNAYVEWRTAVYSD